MSNMQIINLADNINAAFDKVNENFESLDSAITNIDITNIVNGILTEDYFLSVINEEYLQQFTINTSVDLTDVESGLSANASAILTLESRIDQTDSGITVLSQAQIETQAQLDGLVLGGIDEDLLASAIASANSTVVSRIDANSDQIVSFAGIIDSVENNLLLRDAATNDRIDLQTNATNSLTSRIVANENGLAAVVEDTTQLNLSLNQLITDGIEITPEQITSAVGGALDTLTLRLNADSDKLVLESAKVVELDAKLTALDSDTGAEIQAEAAARDELSSTVSLINGKVTAQATDISTLSSRVDSDFAEINSTLQTVVDDQGNASAVYALNLDVNNHIAGIRLENNGSNADFEITADTFKIVNASNNAIQPFTVDGNNVFLSNATVTGDLNVTKSDNSGSMNIKGNLITINDASGTTRVRLGKLS